MALFDENTYGANIIPEVILPMAEECRCGSKYFRIVNTGERPDFYGNWHITICGSGKELSALISRLEKQLGMQYWFAEYEQLKLSSRGKYYLEIGLYKPFYRVKDKTGTFDVHCS